jgi:hypothetical protein
MRARRRRVAATTVEDDSSEWSASPPGRLGRPLLKEVTLYLEFFALAREPHAAEGELAAEPQPSFGMKLI